VVGVYNEPLHEAPPGLERRPERFVEQNSYNKETGAFHQSQQSPEPKDTFGETVHDIADRVDVAVQCGSAVWGRRPDGGVVGTSECGTN